jgi:sodium-dependent dicarboxylate transporter 2/3/5
MNPPSQRSPVERLGLWLGLAAFAVMVGVPVATGWPIPGGFTPKSWHAAALTVLMATWWATEALPIAATSMLPLAAGPLLGIVGLEEAGRGYGGSTIFLILGGCLLALALERSQLHRRIAYTIVGLAGASARGLVLGVMTATAFVSMWVSNTSTTLMMLPVAASIATLVAPDHQAAGREQRHFSTAIVLGVAYASTIGGLGTLIGTPTNALARAFLEQNHGIHLTFASRLIIGLPCVALLLPLTWWVLVRVTHPFTLPDITAATDTVRREHKALGAMSSAEARVAAIGCAAAAAWVASPWLSKLPGLTGLSDMGIAMIAGLALFIVPAGTAYPGTLLDRADLRRVPWDTLFLFGGGLALAALIQDSGLSAQIGAWLGGLAGWPALPIVISVVLLIVFWTELSSNVATAATFMPILSALSAAANVPRLQLIVPAALAASCGFMLPVGTAPNAIVYGSGRVGLRDMMRAGLPLDILAACVVVAVATVAWRWLG